MCYSYDMNKFSFDMSKFTINTPESLFTGLALSLLSGHVTLEEMKKFFLDCTGNAEQVDKVIDKVLLECETLKC
jgi:hypothetical protein